MANQTISNSDNVIDSRDVIKRIAELEADQQALIDAMEDATGADEKGPAILAVTEWQAGDDGAELTVLKALQDEAEGYGDWLHGAALINDSYFETYAREFAEDIHGKAIREASWPFDCIDWEKAAEEMQQDYTGVDFDGTTFWIR